MTIFASNATPAVIEVMLHCYYSPEPVPRREAPAVAEAIRRLGRQALIETSDNEETYHATERGSVWVEMLCTTPFPVAVTSWVDPRTK